MLQRNVPNMYRRWDLIWGLILGWLIWQELPDAGIWPGVGLLVACGLYIIHREARRVRAG